MKPLSLSRPHLIVMVGISGAGKSKFALQFANFFKIPLVSRDEVLTHVFKATSDSPSKRAIADRTSIYLLSQLLRTNQTVVFDGASDNHAERLVLTKLAKAVGYEITIVWVQTDPVEAKRRTLKQSPSKTVSSDEYDALLTRFHVPSAAEKAIVISGKHTFASQLKIVLKHLSGDRSEAAARTAVPERPTRNIIIR